MELGFSRAGTMNLVGGALCLDFTNTVNGRTPEIRGDKLERYTDLVAWGAHTGILSEGQAGTLLHASARHPADADAVLLRARKLREAIYRLLTARLERQAASPADLDTLNAAVAEAQAHMQLAPGAGGYVWQMGDAPQALDRVLWPVAQSAAQLLTSNRLDLVRPCGGPDCGWLFVDSSKNHSRRWCNMADCGNRAKAHRHYAREKQKRGAARSSRTEPGRRA